MSQDIFQPQHASENPLISDAPFKFDLSVASEFTARVYLWMMGALLISGSVAAFTYYYSPLYMIFANGGWFIAMIVAFILAIVLSFFIHKLSETIAQLLFLTYATLLGFGLTHIFIAYQLGSIAVIFGVTAGLFALMSLYGFRTKRDLTNIGMLCMFGLIGIILSSIINIFIGSSTFEMVIAAVGVVVFLALIAYDTQKIKAYSLEAQAHPAIAGKLVVICAFELYLDFVNLFLKLLQLFGKRN